MSVHDDLVVFLSWNSRWHVQSTPMLASLVGLGALVEASLLHVHNHPGWHGVLQQVLRLALFDGALLSLAHHIRSLGQGLGDAARGSPHDRTNLDVQPRIGGVVYGARELAYRLHYPLYRMFRDTTEPQRYCSILCLADVVAESRRPPSPSGVRSMHHVFQHYPAVPTLRSWLHGGALLPTPVAERLDGHHPPNDDALDPLV